MYLLPQIHTNNLESTDKREVVGIIPKATYPIHLISKRKKVNFAAMLSVFTGHQKVALLHKKPTQNCHTYLNAYIDTESKRSQQYIYFWDI